MHKAAHYARHAIGVPDSVVLRGDQVVLYPGGSVHAAGLGLVGLGPRDHVTGRA